MMGEMNYIMVMQHSCKYLIKKLIKKYFKENISIKFFKSSKEKSKKRR